ncbi:uncharacterized protein [Blastocystis hominis]|uniref:Uncharacterized protein n=1 Tax=Blastocystis hominis TaxID=12968 RepID=D8M6I9_BLAHO|nr:uncharacterized protein [Blastocystis hominis]CBK23407.2 unnamed protein product [Blastocystis hominis]|eukprot:XP_012897455.1 uncharacterized protein [Blastocystis hominis]
MAMRQSTPNIQRRDFSLIGSILQFAIDATIITSSMSVLRRTIGLDMHQFAQTIRQPEIRRVTLNYLDFGERCIDKIISLKDYTPRYGNPPDQSYNRWDQQRRDRNDKNQYY